MFTTRLRLLSINRLHRVPSSCKFSGHSDLFKAVGDRFSNAPTPSARSFRYDRDCRTAPGACIINPDDEPLRSLSTATASVLIWPVNLLKSYVSLCIFFVEELSTKVKRGQSVGKNMVASFFRMTDHYTTIVLEDEKQSLQAWCTNNCTPLLLEKVLEKPPCNRIILHHDNTSPYAARQLTIWGHKSRSATIGYVNAWNRWACWAEPKRAEWTRPRHPIVSPDRVTQPCHSSVSL
ncbi:hypothetical protein EVAR_31265_1 [Eumeta japonica]|uniref:Mariner Mos1 transposase n=1 Tax=Eumeta variegata TaxID=151549 RepID=A0A4C1VRI0_EUMVA|nr:hypothetical protein EVAR_31265_1 [Eumeta japonica]